MLNPKGINALRFFPGRGNRVWGARTLSLGPVLEVHQRPAALHLRRGVDRRGHAVGRVRAERRAAVGARAPDRSRNFLTTVWRDRRAAGHDRRTRRSSSRCDRTTMTQDDIDNGRLICVIGIAPVKPAEFVIFRIQQKTLESATELSRRRSDHAASTRDDPYGGYNFEVIVNGHQRRRRRRQGLVHRGLRAGGRGPARSSTATAARTSRVRKIPGLKKFTNITLKRGITGDLGVLELDPRGDERPGARAPRARSSCSTRTGRRSCAGTSSAAGPASGPGPASTPRTTRSRWRRSRSATRACEHRRAEPMTIALRSAGPVRSRSPRPRREPSPLRSDVAGVRRAGRAAGPVGVAGARRGLARVPRDVRRPRRRRRRRPTPCAATSRTAARSPTCCARRAGATARQPRAAGSVSTLDARARDGRFPAAASARRVPRRGHQPRRVGQRRRGSHPLPAARAPRARPRSTSSCARPASRSSTYRGARRRTRLPATEIAGRARGSIRARPIGLGAPATPAAPGPRHATAASTLGQGVDVAGGVDAAPGRGRLPGRRSRPCADEPEVALVAFPDLHGDLGDADRRAATSVELRRASSAERRCTTGWSSSTCRRARQATTARRGRVAAVRAAGAVPGHARCARRRSTTRGCGSPIRSAASPAPLRRGPAVRPRRRA